MKLHIDYCEEFGVSKEQMESSEESEGGFRILRADISTDKKHFQHAQLTQGNYSLAIVIQISLILADMYLILASPRTGLLYKLSWHLVS